MGRIAWQRALQHAAYLERLDRYAVQEQQARAEAAAAREWREQEKWEARVEREARRRVEAAMRGRDPDAEPSSARRRQPQGSALLSWFAGRPPPRRRTRD